MNKLTLTTQQYVTICHASVFSDNPPSLCDGLHKGACYNVFTNEMSAHHDAEGKCIKQEPDGHLVAFHSKDDVHFLTNLMRYPGSSSLNVFLMSGTD